MTKDDSPQDPVGSADPALGSASSGNAASDPRPVPESSAVRRLGRRGFRVGPEEKRVFRRIFLTRTLNVIGPPWFLVLLATAVDCNLTLSCLTLLSTAFSVLMLVGTLVLYMKEGEVGAPVLLIALWLLSAAAWFCHFGNHWFRMN